MDVSLASSLVIVLALVLANLPFFNERLFGVIPLKRTRMGEARIKPFWLRLLELLALYFILGALAYALESRIGNVFVQTWEFYAISGSLFVVLAFPGFVLRYLRKGQR